MKKLLQTTVLALAMPLGSAAADFQDGDFYFNILEGGTTVELTKPTTGDYNINKVVVPTTATDGTTTYQVVAVGAEAFRLNKIVQSVTIPEGVTSIGKKAFYQCISITSLSLPEGLASMGGAAFEGCKYLTELYIPGSCTEWGYDYGTYSRAFADCQGLTKIVIGEGITKLPDSAFSMLGVNWSSIKYLELPSTLTDAQGAFHSNIPLSWGGEIILHSTTPTDLGDVATHSWDLDGAYDNVKIYVPEEALEAYKADAFWGKFTLLRKIGWEPMPVPEPYKFATGVESDAAVSFSARWNDDKALDNLTEMVYIPDGATVDKVLRAVLKGDNRFYAMQYNGEKIAYGFDTNGDGSRGIYVDGTKKFMNEEYGYSVVFDSDKDKAGPASEYDHWKVNSETEVWKFFVNGEVADLTTPVKNGDAVVLEYISVDATAPSEAPYAFYLRPVDEQGVWTLDEATVNTANGKQIYVPMIANVLSDGANLYGVGISAECLAADGSTSSTAYTTYIANGKNGNMSCRVTTTSPEDAILRPYLNIRKVWEEGTSASVRRVYGNDLLMHTSVANPVTAIRLTDVEDGATLALDNMGTKVLYVSFEPADADFPSVKFTTADEAVASMYVPSRAPYYLIGHSEGSTTLTISSTDGSATRTYNVTVAGIDTSKPDDEYRDGIVFLNEEWFTHTSGSLNYVDANGEVYYRAYGSQNDNMAFGATSCSAMEYAGKLFVMSKQPWDSGDTRPLKSGGCVVVADAKTMKHIAAFDEIGGDGRACVGVSPSKVYLSHSKGVRVMHLDGEEITIDDQDIEGIDTGRNGQMGDMVKAGKYVFATNVGSSLVVIDTETDKVVKTLEISGIQTVAQSLDGRVWVGCAKNLRYINPETLEMSEPMAFTAGSIGCSSSSWRPGNLRASTKTNTLFWSGGNWNGSDGSLVRWDLDKEADPANLTALYKHDTKAGYGTQGYGTPNYDPRTDTWIYGACNGFGVNAMYNWYIFVDATTGAVKHTMKLSEYFWFPGMAVIPDKHDPEVAEIADVEMKDTDEPLTIELNPTDADNLDCNISLALLDGDAPEAALEENAAEPVKAVKATLEGKILTLAPQAVGSRTLHFAVESNGKVVNKEMTVNVKETTGIRDIDASTEAEDIYYRTDGVRIDGRPSAPGVYILKQGTSVRKVVL